MELIEYIVTILPLSRKKMLTFIEKALSKISNERRTPIYSSLLPQIMTLEARKRNTNVYKNHI